MTSSENREELQKLLRTVPEDILAEALAEQVSRKPTVEIKRVVQAVAQEYSGPIPPPRMLNEYESVQTGLA